MITKTEHESIFIIYICTYVHIHTLVHYDKKIPEAFLSFNESLNRDLSKREEQSHFSLSMPLPQHRQMEELLSCGLT